VAHWLIGIVVAILLVWVALVVALLLARPRGTGVADALRLMPDLLRLLSRLARDPDVPRPARIALWGLLAYLALPIDVIPDFIPVLGYADDAIAVILVLRYVAHRIGPEDVARHWPGTPDGLAAVRSLTGDASTQVGPPPLERRPES
jgi:uncharacterized membrane protein YkvA (DUF1232 family)